MGQQASHAYVFEVNPSHLVGGCRRGPALSAPETSWVAPLSVRVAEVTEAFARGGLSALARVSGPWAAAFQVHQARQVLIAHDPTGIMPLYWARRADGVIAVSSHLPSLADHDGVDDHLDPQGVVMRYGQSGLDSGWCGMSATDFRGIHRVPFGHAIVVEQSGTVRQVRFWDPAKAPTRQAFRSPEHCAEALAEGLEKAVARTAAATAGIVAVEVATDSPIARILVEQTMANGASPPLVVPYDFGRPQPMTPIGLPSAAGVRAIEFDSTMPHMAWATAADYHRFPSRGRDTTVPVAAALARLGVDHLVTLNGVGAVALNGRGVAAGLLRRGHVLAAWKLSRQRAPDAASEEFKRAVRAAVPAQMLRLASDVRALGAGSGLRGDAAASSMARSDASKKPSPRRSFPLIRSLDQEQTRRYRRARSAREFALAIWMSGAHHRILEAQWAYAGVFGYSIHAPFLDVDLVELALSFPDLVWVHEGEEAWAYSRAARSWVGDDDGSQRKSETQDSLAAPDESLGERAWTENDPSIARLLGGRPNRPGPIIHPRDWPIGPTVDKRWARPSSA